MSTPAPPSLVKAMQGPLNARDKSLIGLAVVIGVLSVMIYVLRQFEFIRPFSVPTSAMAPAVSRGDHVIMEGLTFLARKPRRGDIAVFKTDGIASLPRSQIYFKRIVGEPGDRVRISEGKLYINDKHVTLSNAAGEIDYQLPKGSEWTALQTDVTVPEEQYFVLGDNAMNSSDSRFWGCVPAKKIIGPHCVSLLATAENRRGEVILTNVYD